MKNVEKIYFSNLHAKYIGILIKITVLLYKKIIKINNYVQITLLIITLFNLT